jgi:molybdate transport system ATP-binding protein
MVLVSHRAEEVVGLTERAARLEAGRIVETGPSAAVLRAGEGRIDSVFDADVVGPGRVRCGAVELAVELPEGAAGRVRLAVYATDVIFATEMPRGISARNRLWTEIAAVEPAGPSVLVTLAEPRIRAVVTREAAEALGIRAGARLVAIIKATSLAVISPC